MSIAVSNTLPPIEPIPPAQPQAIMFDPHPGEHCLFGCLIARQVEVIDYYRDQVQTLYAGLDTAATETAVERVCVAQDDMTALIAQFIALTDSQEDRIPR